MTEILIAAGMNGIWQGLLLTFLAWALIGLQRDLNATSRHALWLMVLVIVALLPLLPLGAHVFPGRTTGAADTMTGNPVTEDPVTTLLPSTAGDGFVTNVSLPPDRARTVLAAWMIGVFVLAGRLGLQLLATYRIRAGAAEPPDHLLAIMRDCHDESGVTRPVTLRLSEKVDVPATIGVRRPVILIPTAMPGLLSDVDLRNIITHEMAHIERGDFRTLLLQQILRTVWFFHPAVWWIGRRLDLERELACDEKVIVSRGGRTREYLGSLVSAGEFALRTDQRKQVELMLPMASQLRRRVRALQGSVPSSHRMSLPRLSSITALVTVAAVLIGSSLAIGVVSAVAETPLSRAMTELSSPDPAVRARAAFVLSKMRREAVPAIPALLDMILDETPVRRVSGKTSMLWGRPREHPQRTSPGEEALKALLYVGRPAIEPLRKAIDRHDLPPDSEAVWALNLLRDFD